MWRPKNSTIALFVFEIAPFFNYGWYVFNCSTDFNSARRWLIVAGSTTIGEKTISKVKRKDEGGEDERGMSFNGIDDEVGEDAEEESASLNDEDDEDSLPFVDPVSTKCKHYIFL
ncbi:transmembrane protein, putative [Medicago truncatula]|uniref:Transmembrane protein, putative n=1 Tax=Medicago truncatula TaxID=3880 RepID=G7L9V6_MEDTR|nr:transmembrane protein, putative [Medicago truncatula]